ncbi:MAG: hypothetical protein WCJ61_10520, partial [Paludibacter sp.]
SGGVVTEITEPGTDATEVENPEAQVEQLTNALTEANNMITELSNHVQSNFVATPRTKTPGKQNVKTQSSEELKNEAREKRAIMNGGKK